ncbi:RNA-binding S4 domain-containing protein [Allopusillimonas ginsengisoli]|nr:RNA-binding S4 domain-containing protein [Allopusillimonas ginsengisoli]
MPKEIHMRLDKWLWAARFFKTRGIANAAIDSGKVKLNGYAAKPSKVVKAGDRLQIRAGDQLWEVDVLALNEQRRPASEAQLLYAETSESIQERARQAELQKLAPVPMPDRKGRPTKRERRQLESFQKGP